MPSVAAWGSVHFLEQRTVHWRDHRVNTWLHGASSPTGSAAVSLRFSGAENDARSGRSMSDRSPEADAARLAALRTRLYAPGSTETDRVRYEAFLAEALHAEPVERAERAVPDERATALPAVAPRRRSRGWWLVTVILALAVGAAAGVAASARTAPPTPAATATARTPRPAATSPILPAPIAAAPLLGSVAERKASAAALAEALAVKNSASRVLALRRVGADAGLHRDADWSAAVGCSVSFGYGNVSVDGRPSGFSTSAGETGARPTGTRFRLDIHLTRDANWSWVASGTRTGSDVQVVSVGAGAASSGPAQYAEFTARSTTVITAITIDATGTTPFLWQLQACTPD